MKEPEIMKGPTVVWKRGRAEVSRKRLRFQDGNEEDWYFWGGRNNPSVVFAVTEDGKVIAGRQWRGGSACPVLELFGGHPEHGQSQEEAARRELAEEAGYEAGEIIKLPNFWIEPTSIETIIVPFLARGCHPLAAQKPEAGEMIEIVEIPLNEWLRMAFTEERDGCFKDSKTLAITLLALPHLGLKFSV
ncbi:MAG: NUDIX hydrolase [Candidatus Jorgensenbacteria bacterium]